MVATSVRSDGCQGNTKPSSLRSSTQFLHTVLLGCACRCISAPQMCVYTQAQFFLHSDPVPPEPPTDGWHPASTLTRFSPLAFSRFRCAAQPQLRQSHTGILPPVGSGPQDTEPSFHEGITNTPGPERDLPLTGGEPWKLAATTRPVFLGTPEPGAAAGAVQTPEEQRGQRRRHLDGRCTVSVGGAR